MLLTLLGLIMFGASAFALYALRPINGVARPIMAGHGTLSWLIPVVIMTTGLFGLAIAFAPR